MPDLSSFPIARRWPAAHPDRLQLYAAPTPNGVKISIMLEEVGLTYEPHFVDISKNESKDPAFVSLNPNGRIPAIIDPHGPGGRPIGVWESGAILVYLAEKTGQLIPTAPESRYETLAWVFFQVSAVGPMFGQLGFFLRSGPSFRKRAPCATLRGRGKAATHGSGSPAGSARLDRWRLFHRRCRDAWLGERARHII